MFINKASYQLASNISLWQLLMPPFQEKEGKSLLPNHYYYMEYVKLYFIKKKVQLLMMSGSFKISMNYYNYINVKYMLPELLVLNDTNIGY